MRLKDTVLFTASTAWGPAVCTAPPTPGLELDLPGPQQSGEKVADGILGPAVGRRGEQVLKIEPWSRPEPESAAFVWNTLSTSASTGSAVSTAGRTLALDDQTQRIEFLGHRSRRSTPRNCAAASVDGRIGRQVKMRERLPWPPSEVWCGRRPRASCPPRAPASACRGIRKRRPTSPSPLRGCSLPAPLSRSAPARRNWATTWSAVVLIDDAEHLLGSHDLRQQFVHGVVVLRQQDDRVPEFRLGVRRDQNSFRFRPRAGSTNSMRMSMSSAPDDGRPFELDGGPTSLVFSSRAEGWARKMDCRRCPA